ncbi:tyrosine-type recombinase/integrase [Entomobacter blattae]|uniref:tyrosine-type recombinase/integrase n=1 Tax=Entomobacter blattae TaxID=2762277 RepID=UPI003084473C
MNDLKIRSAKSEVKTYRLRDTAGLFLQISPTGLKTWYWRYKIGGKEKTYTIGRYPTISLADARKERDLARDTLKQGKDPSIEKKLNRLNTLNRNFDTFETVAREWHASRLPLWTARHTQDVIRSLERDVFPLIGPIPIADLTAPIILSVLQAIENRGAIETAHRVRQRLSDIFVHAIATGRAQMDPAAIIAPALRPVIKGRQPAITNLEELKAMLKRVEEEEAHPVTLLAMRLLALTVVRPGELRFAQWNEFEDLEGNNPIWRVPAERMKMKREHLVPLPRQAVETVLTLKPLSGRWEHLFPNIRRPMKAMSENALGYVLNRAGYHHRHVPHGFRASFSSIMNEKFPQDRQIIDLMLAHAPSNKVESAYNRAHHHEKRRELAQAWADIVTEELKTPAELIMGKRKS